MVARFGVPVFLIGSALSEAEPNDIDVRIILPDGQFDVWFGDIVGIRSTDPGAWSDRSYAWAAFCGKQAAWVSKFCGVPLDFQVLPECWWKAKYSKCHCERLDSVPDGHLE